MQNTHPFYIWQVMMRFRTMDKLIGEEGKYRTSAEIARQLFSNFDELTGHQQALVISCKITYPLGCLKSNYLVEERTEKVRNPSYRSYTSYTHDFCREFIDQGMKEYRAKAGAFGDIADIPLEDRLQWTADNLDKDWRLWTGQPSKYDRAKKWLERRGLA